MNNKFLIATCRFHTKEKNKLLIIGWFQENVPGDSKLAVYLDKKKLPSVLEEKEMLMSNLKTKSGMLISKQYFLWVELPEDWKTCKRIRIVNRSQDRLHVDGTISVSKLIKKEKKMYKYIDQGRVTGSGFEISGWYIDDGNVKISFWDKEGTEYPVEMKRKRRSDVRRIYPECTEEEIIGFTASYTGTAPNKIRVHLESDTKHTDYTVPLILSPVEKKIDVLNKGYEKAKVYYRQFGMKATALRVLDKVTNKETITYKAWFKRQYPSKSVLKQQSEHKFEYQPKISIVVPLYKTPEKYLEKLVESVKAQSYSNWELCLSDGSGVDSPIAPLLKKYEEEDKRISVVYNECQLQISENTNAALQASTGDYIAFADHDDLLSPNALYECVLALNKKKDIEIIYTDEDKVDMNGKTHFMPHFKPDFNLDMLRSVNYICHMFVVKRELYQKVGMLNPEFNGAQDYDFVLRCVEQTDHIKHIPKVLYHWRAHQDSTAENPESKRYAFEAGARAVQAHYDRLGIPAKVEETENNGIYRTRYPLAERPLVSVVIPNKDHIKDLEKCIRSLEEKNQYENLEYIIVENNSTEPATFAYYKKLEAEYPKAKVVFWKGEGFNYPAINNYGVDCAAGDYILFLNNDTEIINADCIEEMLGVCMREDVGAVGAKLYYDDGTIQHAGVIVGLGGVAGHAFVGLGRTELGYFGRAVMMQDYSAVTAACMMVKKRVFYEVEGLDERYAVAFNDVDFCLKIRKAGYLIVYNPYAELYHYESKSRGYEDTDEKVRRFNSEIELFESRWKKFLKKGDPYYSPNLTLDKSDFGLNIHVNKV